MYDQELEKLKAAGGGCFKDAYIAGGALTSVFTNQPINDVDVYFKSKEAFIRGCERAYDEGMYCLSVSKRAVTFSGCGSIVQLMYFDFFPTAQDIWNSFDFTINMGAYDFDTQQLVFHEDFLEHNAQRFLKFNPNTRYPIASALRALKYKDRGYTIGKGEFLKIILAARIPEINSWEDLKDQIGGQYGDDVALQNEHQPFSTRAAVDSFDADRVWNRADTQNGPGYFGALLEELKITTPEMIATGVSGFEAVAA